MTPVNISATTERRKVDKNEAPIPNASGTQSPTPVDQPTIPTSEIAITPPHESEKHRSERETAISVNAQITTTRDSTQSPEVTPRPISLPDNIREHVIIQLRDGLRKDELRKNELRKLSRRAYMKLQTEDLRSSPNVYPPWAHSFRRYKPRATARRASKPTSSDYNKEFTPLSCRDAFSPSGTLRGISPPTTLSNLHVRSAPDFLDIVEQFRMDRIEEIRKVLSTTLRRPTAWSGYRAIVRGKIPLPGFVLDAEGRIWHQLATPRFVVLYEDTSSFQVNRSAGPSINSQCQVFCELLELSVSSTMFTSAGSRNPTEYPSYNISVRSVIALQTIREMLHWRYVFRTFLSDVPIGTTCNLNGMEPFFVAEHVRLSYNGETNPDMRWLDPSNWKHKSDYGLGLVAWVNVATSSIYDPAQLLRSVDVTKANAADWARISLQFAGGRSREHAIVFVDLIRFMVIRHHVPATGYELLLCANEFLDRAVAIPELEACVPEILNVQNRYASGHDIDTGAVTRADLLGENLVMPVNGTTSRSIAAIPGSSTSRDVVDSIPGCSGIGLRGIPHARDRRVVMSVWTNPISGLEWKVPERIESQVNFTLNRAKYKLSVVDGHVTCKRVGFLERVKNEVRSVSQIQTPFLSIQREASSSRTLKASGSMAISNALSGGYGEEACLQMLGWLHRGVVNVSPNCTAASFVPRSCHVGDIVVNQGLGYEMCRRMIFGRRNHELFWLPGEGLPCFRVRDCPNGTYKVTETDELPPGVELCSAEINKDFL